MWKFNIEWKFDNISFTNIFIGIGITIGKDFRGVIISNLFIGWENYEL